MKGEGKGRGRGNFYIILIYLNQLLLSKPCAILHLFFRNFFRGGGWVGLILFIPRTVSKHKVQLLPSKVCAILHLLKEKGGQPPPLKKFYQNIIKIKKKFLEIF